jgi:hypothetical protein
VADGGRIGHENTMQDTEHDLDGVTNHKRTNRSTPVDPSRKGVDQLKPLHGPATTGRVVNRSTPICILSRSEEEKRRESKRQHKENSRFGVDRLTTPSSPLLQSSDSSRSTPQDVGLPTPDHLGEVIL